jgi:hypothetical protein
MQTSKYMMARAFVHKLYGNERQLLAPDDPNFYDLCVVDRKVGNPYAGYWWVGTWVFGIGLIDVYFPEADIRPATEQEKDELCRGVVGSTFSNPYKLDRNKFA